MPSASEPATTGDPENVSTYVRPSADGLATAVAVPAPAPSRPTTVMAPASRVTAWLNVTVSDVTRLRCTLPSFTWTDWTASGGRTVNVSAAPDVSALPA